MPVWMPIFTTLIFLMICRLGWSPLCCRPSMSGVRPWVCRCGYSFNRMGMTGKRMILGMGFLGLSFMGLQAEEPEAVEAVEKDFQAYMSSLDSMINVWHVRPKMEPLVLDSINERAEQLIEELPDSVYIARLAAISSPMQFTFNSQVKSYIRLYTRSEERRVGKE